MFIPMYYPRLPYSTPTIPYSTVRDTYLCTSYQNKAGYHTLALLRKDNQIKSMLDLINTDLTETLGAVCAPTGIFTQRSHTNVVLSAGTYTHTEAMYLYVQYKSDAVLAGW